MLAKYQQQQEQEQSETHKVSRGTPEHATVTDVRFLPNPIQAIFQGEPVKLGAFGNVKGFSPGVWAVDRSHEQAWIPLAEVLINDPNYLPVDMEPTRVR
jgi:hypothetical protein